ncbi:MAG: NAD(P)/FAD-dependent oxidoreductase [Tissierellia bacterium]|nr:NAD(P)/FAD-dependent oxidoreductase [Tissierellia bacterium]
MSRVLVVGGGAAGMMAAISARRHGAGVTILERNDRVGKKILATGNGRCNYTNINLSINNYHGSNPKFAYSFISRFGVDETIDFFERLGIAPIVENDGRVFPLSLQSSSVLDVLRFELEDLGIETMLDSHVVDIKKEKEFVVTLKNGNKIYGDRLILTTGGNAAPATGSDGNGYRLAQGLGHSMETIFPGLVQLELDGDLFKQVNGVKFPGVAGLYEGDRLIREDDGDILFTNYGISGPPILQLSRTALEYLNNGTNIDLRISIIHTKNQHELYEYLQYRFAFMQRKTVEVALIGLINKRLIIPVLREVEIDKDKQIAHISNEEMERLSIILTNLKFSIIGSRSWRDAQITAGGISTDEIDNLTIESKLVEGLFFAGEIVDIDGDCGGFNLQWAWSSGYIAGKNAATG